jgi:hypothetical protein
VALLLSPAWAWNGDGKASAETGIQFASELSPAMASASDIDELQSGSAGNIRFALSPDETLMPSPAVFQDEVERLYIFFDYEGAEGEEIGVSVIAPGGVPVFGTRESYEGEGTGRVEVTGAMVYGRLASNLHATLKASRTAADNLKRASVGLSEFVIQLQANAEQSRSIVKVLKRLDLEAVPAADRQAIDEGVERFALLAAQARQVDPSKVDEIRRLAGEMASAIGETLPRASALEGHSLATDAMALPATDPANDQPYDVLLSFEGSPSAAGEFRIVALEMVFLPLLRQR